MMWRRFFFICFVLYAFASCRASKKIQTSAQEIDKLSIQHSGTSDSFKKEKAVELLKKMEKKVSYTTFSSKISIQYEDEFGKQPEFRAFVRMQKDSVIWVSFMATFLNIEGYRLLITPDSIRVMDKMEKTFTTYPYNYIKNFTKFPIGFSALQGLITGELLYGDGKIIHTNKLPGFWQIFINDSTAANLVSISTHRDLLAKQDLHFSRSGSELQVQLYYDEYTKTDHGYFPTSRQIQITKPFTRMKIRFSQYEFNKELSFPFRRPGSYKIK